MRQKKCIFCHDTYYPDPRVRSRQESCGKKECREKMKKESQKRWRGKNPDYWRIDRIEDESTRQALRKRRAVYMREYRKKHPEYVKKDNERRRKAHQEKRRLQCRKQDERFVKIIDVKQLLLDLLPCRNKDVICSHLLSNKRFRGSASEQLPAP